jgi:hypothetical protein
MAIARFLSPLTPVPAATKVAAAGAYTLPNFTIQTQGYDKWCWAAVAASISAFYATLPGGSAAKSQCAIATDVLGFACCPPLPPNWNGNRDWGLADALENHCAGDPIDTPLDFDALRSQISDNRPVGCHIQWPGNQGNHFVVIIGYDIATREVIVRDPQSGSPHNGSFPYDSLDSHVGGHWDRYILTKP